jgi:phenylacetate-CoA ligase
MPRIRYAVGDVGVPTDEECPCGRGLPLMKEVEGRSDSFIQTPDGRIYPQMTFWAIMRTFAHAEEIAQFRVIQERTDAITVPVVRGKNYREGIDEEIRRHIIGVLGEDVKITVSPVDELPRDPTGKVRTVISNAQIQW